MGNTKLRCQIPLLQHNWPVCVQKVTEIHTKKIHQVLLDTKILPLALEVPELQVTANERNMQGKYHSHSGSLSDMGQDEPQVRPCTDVLIFSLVTGNIHNKFGIVRSQVQRYNFVTSIWSKHAISMQMDGTPEQGESHKAQDTFQQVPVQWSTRGHLNFSEGPGTGAGKHHSPNHRLSSPSIPRGSQTPRKAGEVALKQLCFYTHSNSSLDSHKKKTHLICLHSKRNDSQQEHKRIYEASQNKNRLKSLTEHFASYLATKRDLLRV